MPRGSHRRTAVLSAVIALTAAITFAGFADLAEAKRVGGGKSIGRQSQSVTRDAAPPPARSPQDAAGAQKSAQPPAAAPNAPGQSNAVAPNAAARPATAGAAQAAAAPARSRWLAPLAGLAAGLGLAALASSLGFGEELASMMMLLLLVLAAVFVVRMVLARRSARGGMRPALAPAGYPQTVMGPEATVQGYRPTADVSYPAQRADLGGQGAASATASAAAPTASWRVPDGFDVDGFVRNARSHFIRLQASFDAGDLGDLREFTTPEMFERLKFEIEQRNGASNRTDVVTLQADLLGVESTDVEHVASVRYSGMLREAAEESASPFDEVWNLTKPVDGSTGWVLAGIQQLAGRSEAAPTEF